MTHPVRRLRGVQRHSLRKIYEDPGCLIALAHVDIGPAARMTAIRADEQDLSRQISLFIHPGGALGPLGISLLPLIVLQAENRNPGRHSCIATEPCPPDGPTLSKGWS